ncbi:hypothetical protein SEVIR_4G026401v4 [Setaria viridis]
MWKNKSCIIADCKSETSQTEAASSAARTSKPDGSLPALDVDRKLRDRITDGRSISKESRDGSCLVLSPHGKWQLMASDRPWTGKREVSQRGIANCVHTQNSGGARRRGGRRGWPGEEKRRGGRRERSALAEGASNPSALNGSLVLNLNRRMLIGRLSSTQGVDGK